MTKDEAFNHVIREIKEHGYRLYKGELSLKESGKDPADGLFMSLFKSNSGRVICRYELYDDGLIGFFEVSRSNFKEAYRARPDYIGLLLQNGTYLYSSRSSALSNNTAASPVSKPSHVNSKTS